MNQVHVTQGALSSRPRRRRAALATREELRGAHVPKQLRSVDALHRIAAAARQLLAERDFEDVSVADIASAAGVSVGAFYLRFRSKERLIAFLLGDVADEVKERALRESDPALWKGASIRAVMEWYFHGAADAFVTHRGVLRPATLIARQTRDRELLELLSGFNTEIHARFRSLLLERASEIARPDPMLAVNMVILTASAALREALLYREPVSALAPAARQKLLNELISGAVAYLSSAE